VRVPELTSGELVEATYLGPVEGTRPARADGEPEAFAWIEYDDGRVTPWPYTAIRPVE
jgi:hypothetical protein